MFETYPIVQRLEEQSKTHLKFFQILLYFVEFNRVIFARKFSWKKIIIPFLLSNKIPIFLIILANITEPNHTNLDPISDYYKTQITYNPELKSNSHRNILPPETSTIWNGKNI